MLRLATLLARPAFVLAALRRVRTRGRRDTGPIAHATRGTPSPSTSTSSSPSASAEPERSARPKVIGTVARNLEVPWGIAFLPDGTALVTERDSGRVFRVGRGKVDEVGRVEEARPEGEAGLLGVAVSPSYDTDKRVFFYATAGDGQPRLRMTFERRPAGRAASRSSPASPTAFIHDGGRLIFGPDGMLYVSTGETGQPELAQDRGSLGGKILRITPDGDPAPGNPDRGSPVWTLGHRNVQGLAFDDEGRLWATEFGQDTWDELNLIQKGRNYGWPVVEGKGDEPGVHQPAGHLVAPTRPRPPGSPSSTAGCGSARCAASGCGGSTSTAEGAATPKALLRRRLRPDAHRRTSPRTATSGSPRPTATAAATPPPQDDRILRSRR